MPSRSRACSARASAPCDWQASAWHRLTVCLPGGLAEVMIKGDHPVHLGPREVESLRDQRYGTFGDVSERRLHGVQYFEQRSRSTFEISDDPPHGGGIDRI